MSADKAKHDWNPGTYGRFRGSRLRPAIDLIRALPDLPEGDVVDLGCGSGAVAEALRGLGRTTIGVDASEAMLAGADGKYDRLTQADIADWAPDAPPALIFSNAALQWVADHAALLPRLVASLAPGGTLAVQVPHQNNAPSHRLWRALAEELIRLDVGALGLPGILLPAEYHHLLLPLGRLSLWETEYYQLLEPCEDGHPVRRFTEATYAAPILQALSAPDQTRLIEAYETVIDKAYPMSADGSVLFPFRRLFFTLTRES
jgi:trans-aconitate 2-methyltransferase